MINVNSGRARVTKKNMIAHVSQNVAVGCIDEVLKRGALANVHVNTDHERVLGEMFEQLIREGTKIGMIYIVGGANTFVPGNGPIFGQRTAEIVADYLQRQFPDNGFYFSITGDRDVSRDLIVHPYKNILGILES